MKQCSKCNRTYSDDTLKFCLEDGRPLSKVFDREATIVGADPRRKSSAWSKLNIRTWGNWTRGEKLTFLSIVITAVGILIAAVAWRMPPSLHPEECVLYNDVPTELMVNVRTGCDKNPCDDDPRLIIGAYPNGTKVQRQDTPSVRGRKFNWIQVVILSGGQSVWVAENKISCKRN